MSYALFPGTTRGGRDLLDAMVVSAGPSGEVLQDEDDDAAELRPLRIDQTTDTGFSGVATLTSDKLAIHEGASVFASFTCADALGQTV